MINLSDSFPILVLILIPNMHLIQTCNYLPVSVLFGSLRPLFIG